VGATLPGSSDENLVLVSGMSTHPLTAFGHVALGKATPLYCTFQESQAFNFFFSKQKRMSQLDV